jgi:predicted AAA+ superfamily ATPase
MIIREDYLKKIRGFYDIDLIKVITGVRRCGKSVLLKQIADEVRAKGIDDNHIIFVNMEFQEFSHLSNAQKLNDFIEQKMIDDKKYYLFFDEIGNVAEWEKVINSFKAKYAEKVSIFITGSNSNLLASELATHIAGRYVAFKILPFSFKEVLTYKNETQNIDDVFNDYLLWGGFPQRFSATKEDEIITYLENIYDSIVLKDIVVRNKIGNVAMLDTLLQYLLSTPAQTFSGTSIANYFKKDQRNIVPETIYNYLEHIISSYIISRVQRFDIRGKRILTRADKYYVSDLGLSHIKNLGKKIELGFYLENIVYNELIRRGYTVYVGKNDDKEIDFIAIKGNEKMYFQVAYVLADNVVDREFGAFQGIDDNYPKYVISNDKFDFSQNGIVHKNIITWLLEG